MQWQHERSRIAALSRSRAADDPELIEARRNLTALSLEKRIRTTLDAAPPLHPHQVAALVAAVNGEEVSQ